MNQEISDRISETKYTRALLFLVEHYNIKRLLLGIINKLSYTESFKKIYENVSWLTVVVGDPKAPFSIVPLTVDPYFIMLSIKQRGI